MMRKALRGLSVLARKFDAWMCEKPSKPSQAGKEAQEQELQQWLHNTAFTGQGSLRSQPCSPCDRIMNP